ncbi:MAG: acetyl-CoA carboxylase carboxyltransferase subunit beta [Lachnospiraceae bacterium]|nr:acetyl-CoA carboxylase carboxyltransferase subunit beta [Lachnospiraceae bacterium]MDO4452704.1 acetyl-CoA carboxylase carboxyltransferase subunit alpha [Lachnospiraceae bacterium]MDU3181048.1 acetyl-CoA carboxylase carboxyltransferase subunit alpha [Lachnospiraceae bacterium]
MNLKQMFKKTNYISLKEPSKKEHIPEVPEGILKKCNACKSAIFTEDVKNGYYICPKCHNYFRVHAKHRLEMVADAGSFEEWDRGLCTRNPLQYKGYEEKIRLMQEKTGLEEAVVTGRAKIGGKEVALGVCDSRFIMASMGEVVGEKITRMVERATEEKLPVILFACSGGARMQEGITSLMQMTKTAAALKKHSDAGQLYISVLTNPTTGGVTASFAMLGDVILAEPNALIGFAGPRVIEQTIGQKLPKGFQRSEFLLEHGFIDAIVEREHLKKVLFQLIDLHEQKKIFEKPKDTYMEETVERKVGTAWDCVTKSRMKDRPVGTDYIRGLFTDFIELHGDRYFQDDKAIVGGIAKFHGIPVTVIAQEKGRTTKENLERNFGMPSPEGYRKALRLMKQAEKFHRPVICLVDTPGAFCGIEAEERGQGEAIAQNIYEMSALKVPVLSIIIGEGGSGGALAMATANEVWILENAIYSILSPEGFASILWKDSKRAKEAAEVMKLTARELKEAGIVEEVIEEPQHFTVETLSSVCDNLERKIHHFLWKYKEISETDIAEERYKRFRNM